MSSTLKGRKHGLELVIPGEKESHGLFADTEEEIEEWLRTLDQVVKLIKHPRGESRKTSEGSDVTIRRSNKTSVSRSESLKEALRSSIHPELLKVRQLYVCTYDIRTKICQSVLQNHSLVCRF